MPRCGGAGIAVSEVDGDFGMVGGAVGDAGVADGATAVTLGWPERRRWYLDGRGGKVWIYGRCRYGSM